MPSHSTFVILASTGLQIWRHWDSWTWCSISACLPSADGEYGDANDDAYQDDHNEVVLVSMISDDIDQVDNEDDDANAGDNGVDRYAVADDDVGDDGL